ncbi:hypothetical protein [Luteitalea sp.]
MTWSNQSIDSGARHASVDFQLRGVVWVTISARPNVGLQPEAAHRQANAVGLTRFRGHWGYDGPHGYRAPHRGRRDNVKLVKRLQAHAAIRARYGHQPARLRALSEGGVMRVRVAAEIIAAIVASNLTVRAVFWGFGIDDEYASKMATALLGVALTGAVCRRHSRHSHARGSTPSLERPQTPRF